MSIFDFFCCSFGASLAASAMLMIYICSRSLHSSFIVFVYDTATARRSFFVSTFCCNALVCILLIAVAVALRGHSPTINFSFKLHLSLAFLSLALAYPFWSRVPDLRIDTLTVSQLPIVQSGTAFAFFYRIRSIVKQPCPTLLVISFRQRIESVFSGDFSNSLQPTSLFRTEWHV